MLSPEVWSFDPPASSLKTVDGSLHSSNKVEDTIQSHHFNHLVSVVLPDTPHVPDDVLEALSSDNEYYKIKDVSAQEFVKKEFIDAFLKEGHLTALSIDGCIDFDNCLGVYGAYLVLSLNQESYQKLGLEGKATLSKNKKHQRYIVTVDLTASHFTPGKKNYDRVHDCLKNCLQSFNVILSWEPNGENVCPSSVASYLCEQGVSVEVCKPRFIQRRDFNVAVPVLHPSDKECDTEEMLEWLGAFSLKTGSDSSMEDEFLSSYQWPEETLLCGQVAFLCWEGLFTPIQVTRLFKALREYFKDRSDIPWASMYVQGFSDAPVSWNLRPHSYYIDGDNSYTVILKPKETFFVASLISNNKMLK